MANLLAHLVRFGRLPGIIRDVQQSLHSFDRFQRCQRCGWCGPPPRRRQCLQRGLHASLAEPLWERARVNGCADTHVMSAQLSAST